MDAKKSSNIKLAHITAAVAVALGALTMPGPAQAADQKKVKIAVGSRVINIIYPYLNMPRALGYWKDEGYDVELVPMGGSLEAIQQMVAGAVDFAMLNSGTMMQADADNGLDLRSVMLVSATDWSVAVPEDSPVKDIKDFKGKIIGVPALSTGGMTLLTDYLLANGLKPDVDVTIVAVGFGGPALEALRGNRVQGLMFFQTGITGFENLGAKLRKIYSPDWRKMPDFTLATSQKVIDKDLPLVEAVVRGALKGQAFSVANPDCARRIQWTTWPETAPTGSDKATLAKWDLNLLAAQKGSFESAYALGGGKLWGLYTPEMAGTLQDFLSRTGVMKKRLPAETYPIAATGFFEKVNTFDVAAVERQAEECRGY
jgi:NitT/TauT family transport system substrate-binding protein